ncbi:MAG: hypothetical protein COA44_06245 [Arcobacter sp.]|nr:MAG: hypothetical protein COA44_06245 [Arcobacter sp.]
MSFIKSLFGNTDLVRNGMSAIGKMVFTPEEKADYLIRFLNAYEPFKIAQRILAIMFSGVFLSVFIMSVIIYVMGIFTEDIGRAGFLLASAHDLINFNIDTLGLPTSMIVGFYFGGGMIEGVIRSRIKDFKND